MDFCDFCNNMYYIKETEEKSLVFYCKNCGSQKDISSENDINSKKIMSTDYEAANSKYLQYLNPDIIHDHTIPHVNNVICANKDCSKDPDVGNDVMYIKYDNTGIKYIYHCVHCKHFWTNNM